MLEYLPEIIKKSPESSEDVLIIGFGELCVKEKREPGGRHPSDRDYLTLDARRVITFRYSEVLKKKLI